MKPGKLLGYFVLSNNPELYRGVSCYLKQVRFIQDWTVFRTICRLPHLHLQHRSLQYEKISLLLMERLDVLSTWSQVWTMRKFLLMYFRSLERWVYFSMWSTLVIFTSTRCEAYTKSFATKHWRFPFRMHGQMEYEIHAMLLSKNLLLMLKT